MIDDERRVRQFEHEKDRLPGGPGYESREIEDEMKYWDEMVESINQRTKEINMIRKILKGE